MLVGVAVGAVVGALVAFVVPLGLAALGIKAGTGLIASIVVYGLSGALSAGAAQVTGNLLTGRPWQQDLAGAMVVGGAVGMVVGGIGHKLQSWLAARGGLLQQVDEVGEFVDDIGAREIRPFGEMPTKPGFERHHLIEKRFAEALGFEPNDVPSIYLTPEEHKPITSLWREAIGYSNSRSGPTTTTALWEDIYNAAFDIYADDPQMLQAAIRFLEGLR